MKLLEMKNLGAEIKYINTLDIINSKLGTTVGGGGRRELRRGREWI